MTKLFFTNNSLNDLLIPWCMYLKDLSNNGYFGFTFLNINHNNIIYGVNKENGSLCQNSDLKFKQILNQLSEIFMLQNDDERFYKGKHFKLPAGVNLFKYNDNYVVLGVNNFYSAFFEEK